MLQIESDTSCQTRNVSLKAASSELSVMEPTASMPNMCSSVYIQCNSTKNKMRNQTLEEEIQELVKNLTVDPTQTSKYQNSFKSAKDSRPSSTAVGAVGVIFISIPLAVVVILDMPRYYEAGKTLYKFLKKFMYKSSRVMQAETDSFASVVPIYSSDTTLSNSSSFSSDSGLIRNQSFE